MKIIFLLALMLAAISNNAAALPRDVSKVDSPRFGANALTYVFRGRYLLLDVEHTLGLSQAELGFQFLDGGSFEKYNWMPEIEIQNFLNIFGVDTFNTPPEEHLFDSVSEILATIGTTLTTATTEAAIGSYGAFLNGVPRVLIIERSFEGGIGRGRVEFSDPLIPYDEADPGYAAFIIREAVPEPPTFAILLPLAAVGWVFGKRLRSGLSV